MEVLELPLENGPVRSFRSTEESHYTFDYDFAHGCISVDGYANTALDLIGFLELRGNRTDRVPGEIGQIIVLEVAEEILIRPKRAEIEQPPVDESCLGVGNALDRLEIHIGDESDETDFLLAEVDLDGALGDEVKLDGHQL